MRRSGEARPESLEQNAGNLFPNRPKHPKHLKQFLKHTGKKQLSTFQFGVTGESSNKHRSLGLGRWCFWSRPDRNSKHVPSSSEVHSNVTISFSHVFTVILIENRWNQLGINKTFVRPQRVKHIAYGKYGTNCRIWGTSVDEDVDVAVPGWSS